MTRASIADLVRATAVEVVRAKGLDSSVLPESVSVERPGNPEHGDYATNLALRAAARLGVPPRDLAGWLSEALAGTWPVASAEVAGPGFVNLRIAAAAHAEIITEALRATADHDPIDLDHVDVLIGRRRDLVDAIGMDATRYALIRSGVDSNSDVDVARFARQDEQNPLYRVQLAHSRTAMVLRGARDLGIDVETEVAAADFGLLTNDREGELTRTIGDLPGVLRTAAETGEPYRIPRYCESLADAYHRFHDAHRVLPRGDERPDTVTMARLGLCTAARRTLATGLWVLGVRAPERM